MSTPLHPVSLDLSGERLLVDYTIAGDADRARAVADQILVEQTIEFPLDLVPDDDIRSEIVGREIAFAESSGDEFDLRVSFAVEIVGRQFPQLLNVLFGNISMVPGVRIRDIHLPEELLSAFAGPRHGVDGLRERFDTTGPLLATALKPMGTPIPVLAGFARDLSIAGLHLIKDDHSFATQPFCEFDERVRVISAAVRAARDEGGQALYLPSLNVPVHELGAAIETAIDAGVGGFLVLPGLYGFDTMRWIAASTPSHLVVMAHPAALGGLVTDPSSGFDHRLIFGLLCRLAGADVSVFPNFGGRFSFHPDDCAAIAETCGAPLGDLRSAWPAPGGGMTPERASEMVEFYGPDVCLLIGGALYRGDPATQVRRMSAAVEEAMS